VLAGMRPRRNILVIKWKELIQTIDKIYVLGLLKKTKVRRKRGIEREKRSKSLPIPLDLKQI
jgi:hypothetical protein